MKKTKKRRIWRRVLAILVIIVLALGVVAANLLVSYAIDRQASFSMSNSFKGATRELTEDQQWLTDTAEDWTMLHEGSELTVHAYYLENPKAAGRYAVLCHGYGSDGFSVMNFIKHYYELGYSVLVPEAMSHGRSEGRYVGMGWPERRDVVRWIERLAECDPQAQIILHGISMGGATVMMVSGEKLPANVCAIIEDCGYSSVWDEFAWQIQRIFHLPSFPLLDAADLIARLRAGYSFREASAVEQVKKSVTPTLFIHGSEDTFVPFAMLDLVYDAAACEKEKLVVEGAPHGASSWNEPDLYWRTVDDFIARHLAE